MVEEEPVLHVPKLITLSGWSERCTGQALPVRATSNWLEGPRYLEIVTQHIL